MTRRRVILIGFGVVLAALVAWPFIAHYRLKHAVARYARELEARGEKLTVPELVPPLPPLEQNGAPALLSALAALPSPYFTNRPPMMHRVLPGRALVAWREDPLPNDETTNVWPGLRADIERHRATLAQIRAALAKPRLAVDLDFSQGFNLLLPHLPQLKYATFWLTWGAMLDLHEGRTEEALENLQAAVRLVGRFSEEPLLISVLVRFAIASIAVVATWEALRSPDPSEPRLAALQAEWEAVDFSGQIEGAIRMERAMLRDTLAEMRSSRQSAVRAATQLQPTTTALDELKELAKTAIQDPAQGLREISIRYPAYRAWRWWWSYEDELALMRSYQTTIAATRQAREDKSFQRALARWEEEIARLRSEYPSTGNWFAFNPFESLVQIPSRHRRVEIQRRLVVTAIALKRYQRRHGRLPDALEALVPEFCAEVPHDPADGRLLRYRRLPEGGFLLYSVGEDGTDDGGDPSPAQLTASPNWLRGRDVVWPQPASDQEAWLHTLEMELDREKGLRKTPRVLPTNGLSEPVLRELERLARSRSLVLTNATAPAP